MLSLNDYDQIVTAVKAWSRARDGLKALDKWTGNCGPDGFGVLPVDVTEEVGTQIKRLLLDYQCKKVATLHLRCLELGVEPAEEQ